MIALVGLLLAAHADGPDVVVEDLAPLAPRLDGVRVVGLGEGTHGSHAFQQARAVVSPWLAARGFEIVLAEMPIAAAEPLTAYVRGDTVDAAAALDATGWWVWATEENLEALSALRDCNLAGDCHVAFAGIDVQDPEGSLLAALAALGPGEHDDVRALLESRPRPVVTFESEDVTLTPVSGSFSGWIRGTGDVDCVAYCMTGDAIRTAKVRLRAERTEFRVPLPTVKAACSLRVWGSGSVDVDGLALGPFGEPLWAWDPEAPPVHVELTQPSESDFDLRAAAMIEALDAEGDEHAAWLADLLVAARWGYRLLDASPRRYDGLREQGMAALVSRRVARFGPAVVWAHDEHVRADADADALGHHLRTELGPAYLAIGTVAGGGATIASSGGRVGRHPMAPPPKGSVEELLVRDHPDDVALVDTGRFADHGRLLMRSVGATAELDEHAEFRPPVPVADAFDLLLWFPTSPASQRVQLRAP